MYGDEFLYQTLGYKHIYSKLKDVTEEEIKRKEVSVSSLQVNRVSPEEIEEYNWFRKTNYGNQFMINDGLTKAIYIIGYTIFSCMILRYMTDFIQKRNTTGMFAFGWLFIVFGGSLAWMILSVKKKSHLEKPYGVTRGYLVSTFIQNTTTRVGADWYDKIEEVNQCSVIWIEKNDTFLRNVKHSSVKFNYAEREYVWSELVYTPVKIFIFKDNSVELIPTFGEEK